MAADHLRALIQSAAPGRSVRELEVAAGVSPGKLGYWLKPSTARTRLPNLTQVSELGRIIGCSPGDVFAALQRDLDPTAALTDGLAEDERELLAAYRRLAERERDSLMRIATVLYKE